MKKIISYAFTVLCLLHVNNIIAQESSEVIAEELGEVVLSIPFSDSKESSVIHIEKITIDSNKPLMFQQISKSIEKLAGVSFMTTGPGVVKPVIRGLSGNRVVVYNMGLRMENQQWGQEHSMGLNGSGISSVEVIKGPMSVLYGSDAIGGVIYAIPENFLQGDGTKVDLSTAYNSNYQGTTTNVGVKGGSNDLKYIIRGSMTDNGNFNTPDGEVENSFFEETDIKFALGYSTKSYQSNFRMSVTETMVGLPHGEEHHDEDHDDHEDGDDEDGDDDHDDHDDHEEEEEGVYQDTEHTMLSWENVFTFSDSELNVKVGYTNNIFREYGGHHDEHDEDHEDGDDDGDDDDHDDDHDDHDDHDEHEGAHMDMALKTTSLDLMYTLPKLEKLETVIGANFLSQENKNYGEEMLIPDAEKMDFGIFGMWNYQLDNMDITFGSRFDNREIKVAGDEYDYFSFSNSLGLKTSLGSNSIVRLNMSSGYRAPNLAELFSDGAHHGTSQYEIGNSSLVEEQNTQFDVSYSHTNGSNLSVGVDVFYNDISDYIYLSPTGGVIDDLPVYHFDQTDSTIFGGSVHLSYDTNIDWLSFDTSIEYLNGETSDGDNLPMIAPLAFRQDFTIDINDNIFELDLLYKGEQSNVSEFEDFTDSYFTVNLSGSHKIDISENSLNVFWSVDNLLDAEYIDHMSRLKNLGIHEMGRNISVGLNYNF